MKRWMQKLISVLMSLTLILSFGVTAFAGDEETEVQESKQELTQEQQDELEAIRKKLEEEELRKKLEEEAAAKAAEEAAAKAAEEAAAKAAEEAAAKAAEKAAAKAAEEAAVKPATVKEVVASVKNAAPEKEPTPKKEPVLEAGDSKQIAEEIIFSDDVIEQQEEKKPLDENNLDRTVADETKKQDAKPAEAKDIRKKVDSPQAETTLKEEKASNLEPVLKQAEPILETKPDEGIQPDKDKAAGSDSDKKKQSVSDGKKDAIEKTADIGETVILEADPEEKSDTSPQFAPENIFASNLLTFKKQVNSAPLLSVNRDNSEDEENGDEDYDEVVDNYDYDEGDYNGGDDEESSESSDQAKTDNDKTISSNTPAVATTTAAADTTAPNAKTVIEVDGTKYSDKDVVYKPSPTEDKDGNLKLEGIGWSAEDGTLTITNETLKELTVKEGDLTIQATGLNRINKLVSNNVVNIIGTGIMLLDDVDLKESGEVQLTQTTINGTTGSVAVFLKDKNAAGNTYNLINGNVPGLLDEQYTIPEGINLVMPSGTTIIMDSVSISEEKENSSALTISKGASLTVEKGATINTNSTKSVLSDYVEVADKTEPIEQVELNELTPKIQVEDGGKLTVKGNYASKVHGKAGMIQATGKTILEKLGKDKDEDPYVTYPELVQVFKELFGVSLAEPSFIITSASGEIVILDADHATTESGDLVRAPFKPDASTGWAPYTGAGLAGYRLDITSSGILASEGKFKPTGKPTTILKVEEEILWRVIVTENPKRGTWTLSVWYGDTQIFDLGVTTVRARFKFDKPDDWDTENIYVVFIDKDGKSLKAFPAKYNKVTEELVFDSSLVGEFVVVQFDYQGELYSKGFYDELAKLDEVKHLVDLHNGKAK